MPGTDERIHGDKRMKQVLFGVLAVVVALTLSGCCCCCFSPGSQTPSRVAHNIAAGTVERVTRTVSASDAEQVHVVLTFMGGELDLNGDTSELLDGEFIYNLPELEPVIVYDVQDGQGQLEISHRSNAIQWEQLTTEIRNEWKLGLSQDIPLSLQANVGASSGKMELGGMRLTDVDLTMGAAELTVSFDQPNPEQLESLYVHSGAAKVTFLGLGNANMDEFTFDGGLGTYTFDFRGAWRRSAQVNIQAGASHIDMRLPKDIGVRVCPGDLRRGSYDGLEQRDECYVNRLYDQSDITLDISLDLGLGKLEIKQAN
jgi:hypothetical protein